MLKTRYAQKYSRISVASCHDIVDSHFYLFFVPPIGRFVVTLKMPN